MGTHIRFLHLTDLHQGLTEQRTLFPTIKDRFLADLDELLRLMNGPLDLILFTGDLTQSAEKSQFDLFTQTLHDVVTHITRKNRELYGDQCTDKNPAEPLVLMVPGNHDLSWLSGEHADEQYLKYYHSNPRWREEFWANHLYRRTIVNAQLANYQSWRTAWYASHRQPQWSAQTEGALIVGDFAATVERDGFKLFVVGLNSAFLHLSKEDREGKLDVDPRQLHAVVAPDWKNTHHAALLLTHHPASWFPSERRETFLQTIYQSDQFFAHLCGHMHEPQKSFTAYDDRVALQGASLFGLETLANGTTKRIYGYYGGVLSATSEDDQCTLRMWPRRAINDPQNLRIEPDNRFGLLSKDQSVQNRIVRALLTPLPRRPAPPKLPAESLPPSPPLPPPPSPYVSHQDSHQTEQKILQRLRSGNPKRAILIKGQALSGKKFLWQQVRSIFAKEQQDNRQGCAFPFVDLVGLPQGQSEIILWLMRAVLFKSGAEDAVSRRLYEGLERESTTARATEALEQLLASVRHIVVLQIYNLAALWQHPESSSNIYTMLRGWIQLANGGNHPYERLRIVAIHSTLDPPDPTLRSLLEPTFEPSFMVPRFSFDQINQLKNMLHAPLSPDLVYAVFELSAGHVGLAAALIEYIKQNDIRAKKLKQEQIAVACQSYLRIVQNWLKTQSSSVPAALAALCKTSSRRLSEKQKEYHQHLEGLRILHGRDLLRLEKNDYVLTNTVLPLALSHPERLA